MDSLVYAMKRMCLPSVLVLYQLVSEGLLLESRLQCHVKALGRDCVFFFWLPFPWAVLTKEYPVCKPTKYTRVVQVGIRYRSCGCSLTTSSSVLGIPYKGLALNTYIPSVDILSTLETRHIFVCFKKQKLHKII